MKKYLVAAVILLTFLFSSFGQENPKDRSRAELEQKAIELADEALLEISSLDSAENRIFLQILAVDLLWKRDEKRARQIARETAEKIHAVLVPPLENKAVSAYLLYPPMEYKDLRTDFLTMMARYDAGFARQLAIYTAPLILTIPPATESEANQLRYWKTEERNLEQRIAFQVAAQSVAEAQKIGRESLARGVSNESLNLLRRLQIRDAVIADSFADGLIKKLLEADFAKDAEAVETAAFFLQQTDEKEGVFGKPVSCNCPAKPLVLNQQKLRLLAGKWLDHAVKQDNEKISFNFLYTMPVLRKLLPERAAAIKAKYEAIGKNDPRRVEAGRIEEQINDDKTTPESIAALAAKETDSRKRFYLYRQAFIKAANHSKAALEKFQEAVISMPESEEKNWLTDEITANLAGKTAEDGDIDQAREMARKIIRRDRRLGLLSFLSRQYLRNDETAKAGEISNEIWSLLDLKTKDKLPKAIVSYDIFSTIFPVFAFTDTEKAFYLLESVLPEAHESITAQYRLSGKADGLNLRVAFNRSAYVLTSYQKPIVKLAETDFDRTRRLSVYFTKPELSIAAKLLIAQAVLQGKLGFKDFADRNEMIVLKD